MKQSPARISRRTRCRYISHGSVTRQRQAGRWYGKGT